jgi:hypothetical protein
MDSDQPTTVAHVATVNRHAGDLSIEITEWGGNLRCRLVHHRREGGERYSVALNAIHVEELIAALTEARSQL